VGLARQIVVGKHSGSRTIEMKFGEYGIPMSREEATAMLPVVRTRTIELKRPLFDKELVELYNELKDAGALAQVAE